jgi:glycosyltransferase involved in cell wall biosynthesis
MIRRGHALEILRRRTVRKGKTSPPAATMVVLNTSSIPAAEISSASISAPPQAIPKVIDLQASGSRPARVALAHDWLCGYRGGECVLNSLADLISHAHEPAGMYVMFDDRRPLTPAIDSWSKVRSRLSLIPGANGGLRRWLLPAYPAAVADLSRRLGRSHQEKPIDLLLSTSSAAVKGLRPPAGVPHVCYCHAPARYVWSQSDQYAGGLRGLGLGALGPWFRRWDLESAKNVTQFVANSRHIASEIGRCFGREAIVVHPPARTEFFTLPPDACGRANFWLLVGALEPYKRVDLAIEAANRAGHELWIVGEGSMREKLETLAGKTVHFLGRVDDHELRGLYQRARLLLFPQIEDFGIVAVEAQACGLPVVARRAGGALDSVIEGETGCFFDEPTAESLLEAVGRAPNPSAAFDACRRNAERFADARFKREMAAVVSGALDAR